MCAQCMMGATAIVTSASGARSWLATRHWSWLTEANLKRMTVLLLALALVASTLLVSGAAAPPA